MAYPAYIREKARQLRREKRLTIDELAERLAIPRTTIDYWVRDLPIERDHERMRKAACAAARANKRIWKERRDAAYRQGLVEFDALAADPTFRDFVCMYIGEGSKRCRNNVALGNSDPAVVTLAYSWIKRLGSNRIVFQFQYHADQNPEHLIRFWSEVLDAPRSDFTFQRKSNSGQLSGRTWRCKYGVLSVRTCDTMLRSRLQAWMDLVARQWVDSALAGA
jgi:transcriptional regulator with XRE-family HTH domain